LNKEVDMSQRSSAGAKRSAARVEHRLDAEEVLETLGALILQVYSPVVQECLRAARCEIAYLTSTGGEFKEEDEENLESREMAEKDAA
jgi:hypothetical protein